MVGKLILFVMGATTGIKVFVVTSDGFTLIKQVDIPWRIPGNGAIYWPVDWIRNFMHEEILALAEPGDTIGGLMWGADLAVTTRFGSTVLAEPLHYGCLAGLDLMSEVATRMDPLEIYQRSGGPIVDFFMPYAQLLGYEYFHPGILGHITSVEPISSLLTSELAGGFCGHDAVMLQDQGLNPATEGARVIEHITGVSADVFPVSAMLDNEIIKRDDGIRIVGVSHDSVYARLAAYAASSQTNVVANWTGTWGGPAAYLADETPPLTQEMMEAGIAIEGAWRSKSAVVNSSRFGGHYKALIHEAGVGYEEASKQAALRLNRVSSRPSYLFDRKDLPGGDAEGLAWLKAVYPDPLDGIAALIHTAANLVYDDTVAIQHTTGIKLPDELVVGGGWSQNKAYLYELDDLGFKPIVIPDYAPEATMLGLAADCLYRSGQAASMEEAFDKLPTFN
jgi:sugar (pentulose or hexulose) kinase